MNNKLLLLGMCFLGFNSFSQTTVFQTANDYSAWTFVDADLDGKNWNIEDGASYTAPYATQGNMLISFSSSQTEGPLNPDNWAVSALINATTYENLSLSWVRGSGSIPKPEDNYAVYVVQENNPLNLVATLSAATPVFEEAVNQAYQLVTKTVDLSAFDGMNNLYIAFRHYNCTDKRFIMIDDIKIVGDDISASIIENDINITTYPNPVENDLTIESSETINHISIWNVNGTMVYESSEMLKNLTLDVSTFDAGLYFLELTTDRGTNTSKITKK